MLTIKEMNKTFTALGQNGNPLGRLPSHRNTLHKRGNLCVRVLLQTPPHPHTQTGLSKPTQHSWAANATDLVPTLPVLPYYQNHDFLKKDFFLSIFLLFLYGQESSEFKSMRCMGFQRSSLKQGDSTNAPCFIPPSLSPIQTWWLDLCSRSVTTRRRPGRPLHTWHPYPEGANTNNHCC